jgi:uncharacterized DUF497 family protein
MRIRAAGQDDRAQYNFEWDTEKARINRAKHDVSFEEAATVFCDPRMLTIYDDEHSEHEERWITVGSSAAGRVLVVCHTFREEPKESAVIRIYSARRVTRRERQQYEE